MPSGAHWPRCQRQGGGSAAQAVPALSRGAVRVGVPAGSPQRRRAAELLPRVRFTQAQITIWQQCPAPHERALVSAHAGLRSPALHCFHTACRSMNLTLRCMIQVQIAASPGAAAGEDAAQMSRDPRTWPSTSRVIRRPAPTSVAGIPAVVTDALLTTISLQRGCSGAPDPRWSALHGASVGAPPTQTSLLLLTAQPI